MSDFWRGAIIALVVSTLVNGWLAARQELDCRDRIEAAREAKR